MSETGQAEAFARRLSNTARAIKDAAGELLEITEELVNKVDIQSLPDTSISLMYRRKLNDAVVSIRASVTDTYKLLNYLK